jgi:hypothetical protein
MTVRSSKVLDWRKTESKGVHKFGIFRNTLTRHVTKAVPMVTCDESRKTEDALTRTFLGRAVGAVLLKGAQMSQ